MQISKENKIIIIILSVMLLLLVSAITYYLINRNIEDTDAVLAPDSDYMKEEILESYVNKPLTEIDSRFSMFTTDLNMPENSLKCELLAEALGFYACTYTELNSMSLPDIYTKPEWVNDKDMGENNMTWDIVNSPLYERQDKDINQDEKIYGYNIIENGKDVYNVLLVSKTKAVMLVYNIQGDLPELTGTFNVGDFK